jgi:signal transduction histidine kinase
MAEENNTGAAEVASRPDYPRSLRLALLPCAAVVLVSLLAALLQPSGFVLAAYSDLAQLALVTAAAALAFRNALRTHSRVRLFWTLVFMGMALWTISTAIWSTYEIWLRLPVPDAAIIDVFLFVKMVPLTLAVAISPDREHDSRFRAFGLLDFTILITYAFYLYAFAVYAYRLLPDATEIYNFRFDLANAAGNQVFIIVAAIALFRSAGYWRKLYGFYFFAAACYGLGSDLSNIAIDQGRYYSGSLYDVLLVTSLATFVCVQVIGQSAQQSQSNTAASSVPEDTPRPPSLAPSHLAMLVTLSTPLLGIWLLSSPSAPSQLRPFRVVITLLTIFVLVLQLSIKQDLLTAGLIGSLKRLSDTYTSINRFKSHLTQSEKLASLGELVAEAANHIKSCMSSILRVSARLTSRPDAESRIQTMAGKIGQYAQRTDVLVDNMLHFAQETPLRLAPVDVKSLLESAIQLSRVAKLPNVRLEVVQEAECPLVRADSSQLLHVFLQLISNALDALEDSGGGSIVVTLRPQGSALVLEFADSGPGLREPDRVFEPFYTTKPVGKGTGLGLSTCYGIVQQHEGEIACRNRPEGGAVFSIALPAVSEVQAENGKAHDVLAEGVL